MKIDKKIFSLVPHMLSVNELENNEFPFFWRNNRALIWSCYRQQFLITLTTASGYTCSTLGAFTGQFSVGHGVQVGSAGDPHEAVGSANWSVADSDLLQAASGGTGTLAPMCVLGCTVTRWQRSLSLSWRPREHHLSTPHKLQLPTNAGCYNKNVMSYNKTEHQPTSWQVAF